MEWWSGGVVEWWSGGVVEWWSGGVVEWWSGGVVEWWSGGVVEWWSWSWSWNVGVSKTACLGRHPVAAISNISLTACPEAARGLSPRFNAGFPC